jgi:MoaA/NifB/PqqE/SkfB family radical SAM enzyme
MSAERTLGPFKRKIAARAVAGSLTGRLQDLEKLLPLAAQAVGNPGLQAFLQALERDIAQETGMARLLLRVGREASGRCKRKLVENLVFNWGVAGAQRRAALTTEQSWVPSLVVISPTMRCNLRCTGCYSGLYRKDGELSEGEIDAILAECRSLGIYFVVISGGEPYLLKQTWLRLFRKYSDMYFLTYTNGTLLDEPTVRKLARLGNVAPALSVEGYQEHTDRRRGPGVYRQVEQAMARLKRHGVIFGISVTYTRENLQVITHDRFVQHFIHRGAIFAWYFMFMPVGKDPILELVPTPRQRQECGQRVAELRRRHPIFIADFWNDGPAAGGCLAAGRQYLHILNSGRIEPCVFAHFGLDTIRDKSILEAANSPFFRAIRERFPYNETGNLRRPCMIIDNPEVLREAVQEHLIPAGHEHSEDIIRDPAVVRWVDAYAREFAELTDPVWLKQIEDPRDRWYRNGPAYRELFRFTRSRAAVGPERALVPAGASGDERGEPASQGGQGKGGR